MKQSEIFLAGEGDAWYERNQDKARLPDPVLDAMNALGPAWFPRAVLEIGCGNGWRLRVLKKRWPLIFCAGVDASRAALEDGRIEHLYWDDALTTLTQTKTNFYDLIIFGFCLYLVDREDLFFIAAHTDRVLKDGGHIIIHDFMAEHPHRIAYKHKEGVWSYKQLYAQLWLGNPAYRRVYETWTGSGYDCIGVTILRKDMANAYPEEKI